MIRRSDGIPTYNFVVVIDDITMNVNTILRGDDHLSNTPKQIQIYNALNEPLPEFGHLPLVLGKDKSRLSKRHGAMSVIAYRDMGYLPDAMLNYFVRLGWSHGDQEFFTREDLIGKFSIDNIGKSAGVFDTDKLLSLNTEHIKTADPKSLMPHLLPFLKDRGVNTGKGEFLDKVIRTLNTRSKTLNEMADAALFYYQDAISYEAKAAKKFLKPAVAETIMLLKNKIEMLDTFDTKNLEGVFKAVMEETDLKFGKIAQPVRVALTGKTASPGIFEIIEILGRDKVIARFDAAFTFIREKEASQA